MVSLSIVVEGRSDETLLKRLLIQPAHVEFRFYASEGRVALETIGRNILVHRGGPVLVVLDAETLNPFKAEEERGMARFLLERFSTPENCDALAFVPALKVIFFETPGVLIRRFGADAVTESVVERGHYLPDDTLAKVLSPAGLAKEGFFQSLTSEELEELRRGPQASKLIAAVAKLAASAARSERVALASP
jgi:hypothetical protein